VPEANRLKAIASEFDVRMNPTKTLRMERKQQRRHAGKTIALNNHRFSLGTAFRTLGDSVQ